MSQKYNVWNKWDKLETVVVGTGYSSNFFKDIKNVKIRSALTQIADETEEDLENFAEVLAQFGCEVIRPKLDNSDSIFNYIDHEGKIQGSQGVPRAPLQPRDYQLVIGNKLFYTGQDHPAIEQLLSSYSQDCSGIVGPIPKYIFENYKGTDAPNWPTYDQYAENYINSKPLSDNADIEQEFIDIHKKEKYYKFPVDAPCITVVGQDLYVDTKMDNHVDDHVSDFADFYFKQFENMFSDFRINKLSIGGHGDGCFHTLKPGAILSLFDIQKYKQTFPGWDVCYLPDQSWSRVQGFLKLKHQVQGKWWVPGQEDNSEFTHFVETWLKDWVGYVEETVFDVNVLVLDEHHVCVSNPNNHQVNDFLKKHNMEPVYVPFRHRYFWDGGLHCITLDLKRQSTKKDYFLDRKFPILDKGFTN